MEAARVAAERGHQVVLFEKNGHLGGHLREASVPEFKKDLRRLLTWYERQMGRLKIEVTMNREVTPAAVKGLDYDVAILATGSMPYFPDIPGIEKPSVTTCCEVLSGEKEVGKNVVILGGGREGCETAVWLAQKGKTIRVIETLEDVATELHLPNRQMLLDMMEDGGIEILTESTVAEVLDDGIVLSEKTSEGKFVACEHVIVAVGLKPARDLYDTLNREGRAFYAVGDCKEARNLHYAILEGFTVGHYV